MSQTKQASSGLFVRSWPTVAGGLSRRLVFVQGSYAARAELHPLGLAVCVDCDLLNVRLPLSLGAHI
jgi:hypothetical protein